MRLGDVDAVTYETITRAGDDEAVEVILRCDLESLPTVCCAECAHYLPWSDKKSGECAQRHMESEHYPTPTFGCVDFERREPRDKCCTF